MTTISEFRQGFTQDFGPRSLGHSENPTIAFSNIPRGSVLENDTNSLGNPIQPTDRVRAVLETLPATGTILLWTIGGAVVWQPDTVGDRDSFTYRLFVNGVDSGVAAVKLNGIAPAFEITNANTIIPIIVPKFIGVASETDVANTITFFLDDTRTIAYADIPNGSVLENDTGPLGNPIQPTDRVRAVIETLPATGTILLWTIGGAVVWQPDTVGDRDSFTYRLFVNGVDSGVAAVKLNGIALTTDVSVANTLNVEKSLIANSATSIDTSGTIQFSRSVSVGIAFETNSSEILDRNKELLVATAFENSTAIVLEGATNKNVIGANEIESAQLVGIDKTTVINNTLEINTAEELRNVKVRSIGGTQEINISNIVRPITEILVNNSNEIDISNDIITTKSISIITASETNISVPLEKSISRQVGLSSEVDDANNIIANKLQAISIATETDLADVVNQPGLIKVVASLTIGFEFAKDIKIAKHVSIIAGSELNSSEEIRPTIIIPVISANEISNINAIAISKVFLVDNTLEIGIADDINSNKTITVSGAIENSISGIIRPEFSVHINGSISNELAQSISFRKEKAISAATELSFSISLTGEITKIITAINETYNALVITPDKSIKVNSSFSLDNTTSISFKKDFILTAINEINTSNDITAVRGKFILSATETSTTGNASFFRSVTLGTAPENELISVIRPNKLKDIQGTSELQQATIVIPDKLIRVIPSLEFGTSRILPTSVTLPEPEENVPFNEGWVLSIKGPSGKTIEIHNNSSETLLNTLGIPSQKFESGDMNFDVLQGIKNQRILTTMEVLRSHIGSSSTRREAKTIQEMTIRFLSAIPTSNDIFENKEIVVIGNTRFPVVPQNATLEITSNGKSVSLITTETALKPLVDEINTGLGIITEVEAFLYQGSKIGFRGTAGIPFKLINGSSNNLLYFIGIPEGNYRTNLDRFADSLRDEMLKKYINSRTTRSL